MNTMFELLDKVGLNVFFPSLLFNESFWQTAYEKRLSILVYSQTRWIGNRPEQRSFLFKDDLHIEVVRSIRLTGFSYTRFTLLNLIEVLKVKNNYTLSEFSNFGDQKNSPLKVINDIADNNFNTQKKVEATKNTALLAKLAAVKFYTRFLKKSEISGLILSIKNNENYWDHFFKSLQLLDQRQKTDILTKINFYFTDSSQRAVDAFIEEIENRPVLRKLYENGKIVFDVLNINDFKQNQELDYIYGSFIFSKVPTELLIKFGNIVYSAAGRICYTKKNDEKKALQKIAELQSPVKENSTVMVEDLLDLDFELTFNEYENDKAIDLIEGSYGLIERNVTRFSVPIFSFVVNAVKSLRKGGYIEIWDLNETENTKHSLSLFRSNFGELQTVVNFELYLRILKSFEDVSIDASITKLNSILAEGINDPNDQAVTLDEVFTYITSSSDLAKKSFSIDNFVYKSELKKLKKNIDFFELLKRKNIMFFGLPSMLYNIGFKKFKSQVMSNEKLIKFIDKDYLNDNKLSSYLDEYMNTLVRRILELAAAKPEIIIARNINSSRNKDFYLILEQAGIIKENFMKILGEEWDNISQHSSDISNYELMEIVKR